MLEKDIQRYGRQLIVKGWSQSVQQKLKELSVLIDSDLQTAALYLAGAGLGEIVAKFDNDFSSKLKERNSDISICKAPTKTVIGSFTRSSSIQADHRFTFLIEGDSFSQFNHGELALELKLTSNISAQTAAASILLTQIRNQFST